MLLMLFSPQQNMNVEASTARSQVIKRAILGVSFMKKNYKLPVDICLAFTEFTKLCWQIRTSYVNGDAYFQNLKYPLSVSTSKVFQEFSENLKQANKNTVMSTMKYLRLLLLLFDTPALGSENRSPGSLFFILQMS